MSNHILSIGTSDKLVDKLTEKLLRLENRLDRIEGCLAVDQELAETRPARSGSPRFEDLTLPIPDARAGRLDKLDVNEAKLDADELAYRRDGFLIKEGLIPEKLTAAYLADRLAIEDPQFSVWGGSYMAIESMRDVCLYPPLVELIEKLIGVPLALFLTLSGIHSSRREWHQDFYLKAGYENTHYCAVWIALGDVHPDAGPYEFVPGSHRLPSLRKELVDEWLQPEERVAVGAAPRIAERFVTAACNELIAEKGYEVRQFVPRRGDVLVWHHSLLHQGSRPRNPELIRPGVIAHYNSMAVLESNKKSFRRHGGGAYVVREDQEAVMAGRTAAQALVDASKQRRHVAERV